MNEKQFRDAHVGNFAQAELRHKSVLKGAETEFNTTFSLRRICVNVLYAKLTADALELA